MSKINTKSLRTLINQSIINVSDSKVKESILVDAIMECANYIDELEKALELKSATYDAMKIEKNRYLNALREIDCHIKATSEPINYIVKTLKENLPEYEGW